jgi:hypothetical protein
MADDFVPIPGLNPAKNLETFEFTNNNGDAVNREGVFVGSPTNADAMQEVDETPQAARVILYDAAGIPITDSTANAARTLTVDPTTGDSAKVSPYGVQRASTAIGHAEISAGTEGTYSNVHKFGKVAGATTTYTPICIGGIYRMPQVANVTALRVKAGDVADDVGGAGARTITLQGLDETGALVNETIDTGGTSAGPNSTTTFLRLFRAFVATSGTYPVGVATGSHVADIVIENAAGSEDWLTISSTGLDRAQSQVGCYTIPLGKEGFLETFFVTVDSNKAYDIAMCTRTGILQTAAPYDGLRAKTEMIGLKEAFSPPEFTTPGGPFPALTDIIWLTKATSTGTVDVSVDFELLIRDTT